MSEKRVSTSACGGAKAANMIVLVICIGLIAAAGAGCGGGAKVNTSIYVPDLDQFP